MLVHDAAGNMAGGPRPGAEDTRLWLRYDAWNRLTHVSANSDHNPTIAEYRYDGLHRRISKAISGGDTFHYYYNENWQVLEVTKGSAAYEQYVRDARYIDAPVLRWRDANNSEADGLEETLFYTNDANMNVTAMVDVSGNVVERYRYDAYGKVTFLAGTNDLAGQPTTEWTVRNASIADNQVLYCGYRFDPETGLYQVRYRMLHPTAGRWMQRDPAGYVDGMGLYEYVRSTPIAVQDPFGEKPSWNECWDYWYAKWLDNLKQNWSRQSLRALKQAEMDCAKELLTSGTKEDPATLKKYLECISKRMGMNVVDVAKNLASSVVCCQANSDPYTSVDPVRKAKLSGSPNHWPPACEFQACERLFDPGTYSIQGAIKSGQKYLDCCASGPD